MTRVIVGILFVLVLIAGSFAVARREKIVSGTVLDCETGEPIPNAGVSLSQTGWGISNSGSVVWDKTYAYQTVADKGGMFAVSFTVGDSANILAEKEGYFSAQQWEYPSDDIVIKLLKNKNGADNSVTTYCTVASECLKKITESGTTTYTNVCTGYE